MNEQARRFIQWQDDLYSELVSRGWSVRQVFYAIKHETVGDCRVAHSEGVSPSVYADRVESTRGGSR